MATPDIESREVKRLAADIDARLRALPSRKTEIVRAMRREFSKRMANAHAVTVIGLALELLERPNFEYRFVAMASQLRREATHSQLSPLQAP